MRIKTGIPGLDELIEGGFPDPSIVLAYGAPGAGKSIFSLQFLMNGAASGEKGLYITTLSEKFNWMVRFMSRFEFFKQEYFENGSINYVDIGEYIRDEDSTMISKIKEEITVIMPKRIVIDPINPIQEYIPAYREFLFDLVDLLKKWDATVVLTSEKKDRKFDEEMYMADGIIELIMQSEGEVIRRYIRVIKMRGTNHSLSMHPLSIDEHGMSVLRANF